MKKLIVIIILLLPSHLMSQYRIPISVLGNGGFSISNSDFHLSSTIGQTAIRVTQINDYRISNGFWSEIKMVTNIKDDNLIPIKYDLMQNYPNPFNPTTIIEYQLPEESDVTLKVYDVLGREINVLVREEKSAGNYKVNFNARNLASGIYFYRIDAKSKVSNKQYSKVGKMILMK